MIQHAARARHPFQCLCDRGIGQLHDERKIRAKLFDPQRGLERVDLVDLHTDHGGRPGQTGLFEPLTPGVGARRRTWGTPQSWKGPPGARIGIVVDDDDRGSAQVETFRTGAQSDALQAADDHVALHAVGALAIHDGMVPGVFVMEVAAV